MTSFELAVGALVRAARSCCCAWRVVVDLEEGEALWGEGEAI